MLQMLFFWTYLFLSCILFNQLAYKCYVDWKYLLDHIDLQRIVQFMSHALHNSLSVQLQNDVL